MADVGDDWATWFDQHGTALVLFARQWTPSRADAEDVVQEAFVRFWKSRARVAEPVAYLFACVKHCALDWQRTRTRRVGREEARARPESEELFTSQLEQDERRMAIESRLLALPEEQREVLVMKIWGGLTFPQIAAALEASVNTVSSRYRYALEKLREQLAEERIR